MNGEMADCLEDHAEVLQRRGQLEDAARMYASVAAVRESLVLPRSRLNQETWKARIQAVRELLGMAEFDKIWAAGRTATLEEAVELALLQFAAAPVVA